MTAAGRAGAGAGPTGRRPWVLAILAGTVAAGPLPGAGQTLENSVRETTAGQVAFEYVTDPDVELCENGSMRWQGPRMWNRGRADSCVLGIARVTLEVRDGAVVDLVVGPPTGSPTPGGGVYLGRRDPEEVAHFLLGLARTARPDVAADALMPAVIARGVVVGPELEAIALDETRSGRVRESAIFWLSQTDADPGRLAHLYDVVTPEELKGQIIFALSQTSRDEAVVKLMEIALADGDRRLRERALFWLGESDDPRVDGFLMDLILPGGPR